ncbi:MAG: ABC transporter substrate-binding protein [Armatimonadota bacterium]|nr:ABC transporter substrate-binding protein [Armatimonadota bacterium]MDR7485746.1 ABC transporter substrate-binding protein [Armatimonadota bacterium]MDR7537575.1 ABC transporter substrate-binding protein [Armatimonadota bacterium]
MTRRKFLASAAAGGAALVVPDVLRAAVYAAPREPIRVGFPAPLTGAFADEANYMVQGATLAVEEFNRAGGVLGRPVELLVRDDRLSPDEGARRTLELIERERVHFLAGVLSAAVQLAVNEQAKRHRKIFVSTSQSDKIVMPPDFGPWTFHEALTPTMTSTALAQYVLREGRGRRVYILYADYAYGQEHTAAWRRVVSATGAALAGVDPHPLGTTDYSAYFPKIVAARADLLVLNNFGRDIVNSAKQAVELGLKRRMQLAVPIIPTSAALEAGPEVLEDVLCASSFWWEVQDRIPKAKEFNTKFSQRFNRVPSDYAAYGYSGVRELLEAAERARSTESDAVAKALEGRRYAHYKDGQYWRQCDHQSIQSIFLLKGRGVPRGSYGLFDVVATVDGERVTPSCEALGHR